MAEPGQDASSRLRVLTYNLLHDGGWSGFFESGTHLEERLEMTIQELRRLQPDIIALQEASESRKHGNVPQRIAEALGYQMVFAPATERIFGLSLIDKLITAAIGFKEGTAEAFVAEVRRIAAEGEVVGIEDTEFGRKYTVHGELAGPRGAAWVSTIWIQERGKAHVRLVTVRPRWP